MSYEFEGKVALITGGANGIGLVYVKALLNRGAKAIIIADISEKLGNKVVAELGDKTYFIKTDVRKEDEFENAFKGGIAKFGQIDIVVNNAGIIDEKRWKEQIEINTIAVVTGSLLAFQYMGKNNGKNGGIIVNTASLLGLIPLAATPVYSGTKHFVVGYTRSLGTDFYLNMTGIKVATVCPGLTNSNLFDNFQGTPGIPGQVEYMQKMLDFEPQSTEKVGDGLIEAINGPNGGVWVATNNLPPYLETELKKVAV